MGCGGEGWMDWVYSEERMEYLAVFLQGCQGEVAPRSGAEV